MSVIREHEEFIWLHSSIEENESYAGMIVLINDFIIFVHTWFNKIGN